MLLYPNVFAQLSIFSNGWLMKIALLGLGFSNMNRVVIVNPT